MYIIICMIALAILCTVAFVAGRTFYNAWMSGTNGGVWVAEYGKGLSYNTYQKMIYAFPDFDMVYTKEYYKVISRAVKLTHLV